jgi:hypothetical protein
MKRTYIIGLFALVGLFVKSGLVVASDAVKTTEKRQSLTLSGYVQMQYQVADTAGMASMAGGNFASGVDNRFMIRRGRVKLAYEHDWTNAVLQVDMTEKGLALKDAYFRLTDPWLNIASLTGGVFDRPFGYEITYSSSKRETPERSRLFQTLFPGERDLGVRVSVKGPSGTLFSGLGLDVALVNGNGIAVESDHYKDLIAHLSLKRSAFSNNVAWGLGVSGYLGGPAHTSNLMYTMREWEGIPVFYAEQVERGSRALRRYLGIDAQLAFNWAPGRSQLRAEWIEGQQPGLANASTSLTGLAGGPIYLRPFTGFYLYYIQQILTTPLQFVWRWDLYDPNTAVGGNAIGHQVGSGARTGQADVGFATIGWGLNYQLTDKVKLMAYYDRVTNETTVNLPQASTLTDFSKDRQDNLFTVRVQYAF